MVETKTNFTELEKIQSLEAEVKQLNQKLLDKDNQLQEAKAKLKQQEKLADLGMFTAEIFHDFQNYLSSSKSSTNRSLVRLEYLEKMSERISYLFGEEVFKEVSEDHPEKTNILPKLKSSINNIKNRLEQITNLSEKINSYIKPEQHLLKSTYIPKKLFGDDEDTFVELNNFVADCLNFAGEAGQNKKKEQGKKQLDLKLNINLDSSIGKVKINQEDLRRILTNLIDNAFYTVYEKAQKIDGNIYQPTISIKTEKTEKSVNIIIEDNGEGIEMGFQKAMKPLISTKPQGEGTGLGLSIVTKLCKENGIEITGKTEPGKFTLFLLSLSSSQS
ncbi:MAG: ATP-binding protein [Pleurocapsa sp. MO_226.B13]|nr:ATP-binding protein [Pleurocapsa sp. MO_226.B13]